MTGYIHRRLLAAIPVVLGVSLLTFFALHLLPGDPVLVMLGESGDSPERVTELRAQLGLDDPIAVQYARFLGNALRGDLGRSIRTNRPVLDEIRQHAPRTLELTLAGLGVAVILGISLGVLAAHHRNRWLDRVSVALSLVGVSMPSFWLGMLLIFLFALQLGWLPATGQGGLERLVLPALTLGVQAMAVIALVTRAKVAEVLAREYVTTARGKGVPERVLLFRHALRNALLPVVTIVGLQFGALLGGSVIIENVFARQGMGRLAVEAILNRDVPIVQGVVLVSGVIYVLINLVVDLLYATLDPRIRYE
jgi:peptide/nickel transport system permease protein/oligopeptide transport system permease protein